MKGNENVTCVWMCGILSLRVGTKSENNVAVGEGDIRDGDIGNGPREGGRVRGTYPIGTESLRVQHTSYPHECGLKAKIRLNIGRYAPRYPAEKRQWVRERACSYDRNRPFYTNTESGDASQTTVEGWRE